MHPPGNARGLHARCTPGGSSGAARGDFNADGIADLAVGAPYEDQDGIRAVGGVHVFYGTATGLSSTGDQFGYALSAWNYGRDDRSDLAIGAPFEDLPAGGVSQTDAGAVVVIYGTAAGLTATTANPAQLWHQNVSGVNDVLQQGDRFGHSLY